MKTIVRVTAGLAPLAVTIGFWVGTAGAASPPVSARCYSAVIIVYSNGIMTTVPGNEISCSPQSVPKKKSKVSARQKAAAA